MISLGKRNSQFPKVCRHLFLLFSFLFFRNLFIYPSQVAHLSLCMLGTQHMLVLEKREAIKPISFFSLIFFLLRLPFRVFSISSSESSSHVLKWAFFIFEVYILVQHSICSTTFSFLFHLKQRTQQTNKKNTGIRISVLYISLTLTACSELFSRNSLWWFSR